MNSTSIPFANSLEAAVVELSRDPELKVMHGVSPNIIEGVASSGKGKTCADTFLGDNSPGPLLCWGHDVCHDIDKNVFGKVEKADHFLLARSFERGEGVDVTARNGASLTRHWKRGLSLTSDGSSHAGVRNGDVLLQCNRSVEGLSAALWIVLELLLWLWL